MNIAITGATSGIGEQALKSILNDFEQIFILARNEKKASQMIGGFSKRNQEKCHFIYIDLADMASVVTAAKNISSKTAHLDVLINNAGGIFKDKVTTKDGFELGLSANHLGHFLLTNKLLPLLLKSKVSKVIHVSSEAHRMGNVNFNDLNYDNRSFSSFGSYANVKLFNILFSKSLVEKFGSVGLKSYALHPGVVKTNFGQESAGAFSFLWKLASPFMITAEQGAQTTIYLAKNKIEDKHNGAYFKKSKPTSSSKSANSKSMRDKLWKKSAELLEKWM
jgi:NAD(P)-dependent dehydrogenase (short-subunit alcohol dehydrogenase family)